MGGKQEYLLKILNVWWCHYLTWKNTGRNRSAKEILSSACILDILLGIEKEIGCSSLEFRSEGRDGHKNLKVYKCTDLMTSL